MLIERAHFWKDIKHFTSDLHWPFVVFGSLLWRIIKGLGILISHRNSLLCPRDKWAILIGMTAGHHRSKLIGLVYWIIKKFRKSFDRIVIFRMEYRINGVNIPMSDHFKTRSFNWGDGSFVKCSDLYPARVALCRYTKIIRRSLRPNLWELTSSRIVRTDKI